MNLLWLLGIPAIVWMWAVSVPFTLDILYKNKPILDDCWWRGPTYFVFNTCTGCVALLVIVFCFTEAFK